MASKLNMVDLQSLHVATELTAPAIALQHGSMQLAVALRLKLHSRVLDGWGSHGLAT